MILNTKTIDQVPSDKVLFQGKSKSDQLFDQYILKEAKAFADTNQSNFMADLEAKIHNEKFKMYDKFNDFDRNGTFLTNASFSIRNPDTSLLLADRYSDDNAHFSIANNPIKLYSFFDDMAPVVDYRHTNDLYYGLKLQGKTPQDIALSNAIYGDTGDHNNLDPTTRGIRQLGGDPSVEAEVFVENFMSSQKNSPSTSVHSSPRSQPSSAKSSPVKNTINADTSSTSPEKLAPSPIEIQPPKRNRGKENMATFVKNFKESDTFQGIKKKVSDRGERRRELVQDIQYFGKQQIRRREDDREEMGEEDTYSKKLKKAEKEGGTYVDKEKGKHKNYNGIRIREKPNEYDKTFFKKFREQRNKELEENKDQVQANKKKIYPSNAISKLTKKNAVKKIVKFLKNNKNTTDNTTQKENNPPLPPKETTLTSNLPQLQSNLDLFFTKYASTFKYIEDKENKSQLILSPNNGKEKVGADMAKFMRDKLNISVVASSNLLKANTEINKLEEALKTMKQSPRMGKRNSKKVSQDDNDLHFENRTPANSKNADATREARAVSQGSERLRPKVNVSELAPNGTRHYKDHSKTTVVMPKSSVFNGKIVYE